MTYGGQVLRDPVWALQFGHGCKPWMTTLRGRAWHGPGTASIRPRLQAVDDYHRRSTVVATKKASIRPRLQAVDDRRHGDRQRRGHQASIRPRLQAVDDLDAVLGVGPPPLGFNSATAASRG